MQDSLDDNFFFWKSRFSMTIGFFVSFALSTIDLHISPVMALSWFLLFPWETQDNLCVATGLPKRSVSTQAMWSVLRSIPIAPQHSFETDSGFLRVVETKIRQLFLSFLKRYDKAWPSGWIKLVRTALKADYFFIPFVSLLINFGALKARYISQPRMKSWVRRCVQIRVL